MIFYMYSVFVESIIAKEYCGSLSIYNGVSHGVSGFTLADSKMKL